MKKKVKKEKKTTALAVLDMPPPPPAEDTEFKTMPELEPVNPVKIKPPAKLRGRKPFNEDGESLHRRPVMQFYNSVELDKFKEALSLAGDKDPVWHQLLYMMTHPSWARVSFPTICQKLGLRMKDLVDFWRDNQVQMGVLKMMNQMPEIMSDVATDARSKQVYCPKCDGIGQILDGFREEVAENGDVKEIPLTRLCPQCEGGGKIRQSGDKDARNLVFETAGLTGKKGPVVAIQQNFNADIGDTVRDVGKIISGDGK